MAKLCFSAETNLYLQGGEGELRNKRLMWKLLWGSGGTFLIVFGGGGVTAAPLVLGAAVCSGISISFKMIVI